MNVDLPTAELTDEKVLLAIAVDVGPAGRRVPGAFDPNERITRLDPDRRFESLGVAGGDPAAHEGH
jgi:hypothetical protein